MMFSIEQINTNQLNTSIELFYPIKILARSAKVYEFCANYMPIDIYIVD